LAGTANLIAEHDRLMDRAQQQIITQAREIKKTRTGRTRAGFLAIF